MPNSKIKKLVENGELPPMLYKYRALNQFTRDMIFKSEFYFPVSSDFNDPYELEVKDLSSYTTLDLLCYQLKLGVPINDALSSSFNISDKLEEIKSVINDSLNKKARCLGIYCLSETNSSILMWSHYADNHRGCVIGIDTSLLPDDRYYPLSVNYQTSYPKFSYLTTNSDNFLKKWVTTKYIDWQYEQERRIVLNNNHGVIHMPDNIIKEIIFGCNADQNEINNITSILRNKNKNIEIKQAQLSHKKYELIIK